MRSLALSDDWDLTLDAGGNLAVVDGTPRVVQDVACYERTFKGEPLYERQSGVPYLQGELAHLPPPDLVRARADARARQVPGVAAVETSRVALEGRVLTGTIHITTTMGDSADVAI